MLLSRIEDNFVFILKTPS